MQPAEAHIAKRFPSDPNKRERRTYGTHTSFFLLRSGKEEEREEFFYRSATVFPPIPMVDSSGRQRSMPAMCADGGARESAGERGKAKE